MRLRHVVGTLQDASVQPPTGVVLGTSTIQRYRLYGIDLVINRTLVGVLTATGSAS